MTENTNSGCSQRDSAEHEGYAKASRSFNRIWKERDSAQPKLLEAILYKDNLNRAYKRVKANKGAAGIDGMSIEETLPYLKEHQQELKNRILRGKYTPSPVRRVEIPKPDGGVRKLGIPTVIDRTIQQAITQQLVPIYEPLFADGSFGYRPGRSAKDAILKVKEYAEEGYTYAVSLDLSKYFDTLNHEILINLLHTRFILPPIHPTKFFACLAGRFFFYGTGTANLSISHDKEATRSMSYRDNLFLNARFKEAVQAAHDQDWQAFEKYSFYDARMMEDLLYK